MVTATVRPTLGRARVGSPPAPPVPEPVPQGPIAQGPIAQVAPPKREPLDLSKLVIGGAAVPAKPRPISPPGPQAIEPGRRRRIARGRDEMGGRLDLHGLDQERARSILVDFLVRAQDEGVRSVLVITGKGLGGQGVLRRRAPEWLADPGLRHVVAGLSSADAHHGGEGAFYIALKRKPR
jgi:DNA-nicking Smr family endonuclease